jgi:heavy metal sensor kinase
MGRSLRWRLQAWYALLLFVTIAGLLGFLYALLDRSRHQEVDGELLADARILEGVLRGLPPPDAPPPPEGVVERALSLPPGGPHREGTYFAVWEEDGELLRSEGDVGEMPDPPEGPRPVFRHVGHNREVLLRGPRHTLILVGRPMEHVAAGLNAAAWQLGLTGLGVWLLGLAGGWWLSREALRPLEGITNAAEEITAANLTRRIDRAETDSELGQLAGVLNRTFDRLAAALQQQARFTADASHEMRTPLTVILSQIDLALSRERPPEEYRDALEACRRAARRMRSLAESLLTLARFDVGGLPLDLQPCDLGELAAGCVEMAAPMAAERGVVMETELPALMVRADAERVAQVITNLVVNAVLYNRPGGKVRVEASSAGGWAELRVTDSGVGIAREHLPRVFERFYRACPDRSRDTGGSGLGLAICKSIVEAHGGTISVESELGVGTTVRARFPLAPG